MEESIKSLVTSFNSKNENKNCPIIAFQFVSLDSKDKTKLKWWSYDYQDISEKYDNIVTEFIGKEKLERTLINYEYDRAPYWTKFLGKNGKIINLFNESRFKFKVEPDPVGEKKADWYNHTNPASCGKSNEEVLNDWGNLLEKNFGKGTAMWVSIPHKDANKRTIYSSVFCLFNDEATQKGLLEAYFLIRDFITNYLIDLYKEPIEEEVSVLAKEVSYLQQTKDDFANKIVEDYPNYYVPEIWLEKLSKISDVFKTKHPILIIGETGTGKEIIAKIIHERSNEPQDLFTAINCSGYIGDDLMVETELFGIGKGVASTVGNNVGYFEKHLNGGTIFFDEIQQMPLKFQMKLKRVIAERKFIKRETKCPKELETKARLIFATNVTPRESLENNQLLEDFYYRINTIKIYLPTLSEMKEEINNFINKLLENINKEPPDSIKDAFPKKLKSGALDKLRNHHYGGNIRELQNTIRRACFISKNTKLIDEKCIEFDDEIIKQNELDKELANIKSSIVTGKDPLSKEMSKAVELVSKIILAKKDLERNNKKGYAKNIAVHKSVGTKPDALREALKRLSKEIKTIDELNPSLNLASIQQISTALKKDTT